MKHKKVLLSIVIFLLGIVFITGGLFLGYKLGIGTSHEVKNISVEPVDVKTIAIVNLDEGIVKDEKTINYANELIDYTNENLVSTSLEDARNGVEEGNYAAYVIIPATFSKNVNSINETPVESEIQYALHTNLTSQAGMVAMSNIYMLIENLNNNVSYMYVDSILNEFHTAQNSVEEVMENGKLVSDAVNNIEPDDINANVDLPSDEKMEYSPDSIDFSGYLQENAELISGINQEYSDGYSKSGKEKDNLTSAANALEEKISSTNNKLKSVDIELDEEGNYVYDTELKSLSDSLNSYNEQLSGSVQKIGDTIKDTSNALVEYEARLNEIDACYLGTVEKYNSDIANNVALLNEELTSGSYVLNMSQDDLKHVGGDDADTAGQVVVGYPNNKDKEYTLVADDGKINLDILYDLLEDLIANNGVKYVSKSNVAITNEQGIREKIEERISTFNKEEIYKKNDEGEYEKQTDSISAMIGNVNQKFTTLKSSLDSFEESEVSGINTETIVEDVKGNVVNKLSENAKNITNTITGEYEKETETLTNFNNSLAAYDPFAYIDQKAIQQKYSDLKTSTSGLESAIQNKDSNDMEGMNNIYMKYSENVLALRESIDSAVNSSNQSVEAGLNSAKNTLASNNDRNEELLGAFIKKLPYTRNGSLGNYSIYKYIVDPCESQNMTKVINETKEEETVVNHENTAMESYMVYAILIPVGVAIVLAVVAAVIYRKRKKNNYNL